MNLFLRYGCRWLPLALGMVAASAATGAADERNVVMDITQQACEAFRTADMATVEKLLAPTFTLVGSDSTVQDRASVVAEIRSGEPKYQVFRNHSMSAQVFGTSAVVQGITQLKGTSGGRRFEAEVRFTDTLVKARGQWQLVVSHVTRIPAPVLVPAPGNAAGNAALVAELTAQADAWDKAIVRKDRAAIEGNMAEDFRQIGSSGEVETKTSFVADLVSPDITIDPYTVEDFDVRIYGDTALLSGSTRMTGRYQGQPFSTHYRYIDIYVKRGGQWKIVSVQTTRIAKPSAQ